MENLNSIKFFLNKLFNPSDKIIIFDLGSRDCKESIEFSKLYNNSKIFAFEPNPVSYEKCIHNTKSYPNIEVFKYAVLDSIGNIKFFPIDTKKTITTHTDGNPGASSLFESSGKYPVEDYVQNEISVKGTRIDEFCKNNKIKTIDFVWMDLQGAELKALVGFGDYLDKVKIIHTEASNFEIYKNQPLFKEVKRYLNKNKFILLSGNKNAEYFDNYIFVNYRYIHKYLRYFIAKYFYKIKKIIIS